MAGEIRIPANKFFTRSKVFPNKCWDKLIDSFENTHHHRFWITQHITYCLSICYRVQHKHCWRRMYTLNVKHHPCGGELTGCPRLPLPGHPTLRTPSLHLAPHSNGTLSERPSLESGTESRVCHTVPFTLHPFSPHIFLLFHIYTYWRMPAPTKTWAP